MFRSAFKKKKSEKNSPFFGASKNAHLFKNRQFVNTQSTKKKSLFYRFYQTFNCIFKSLVFINYVLKLLFLQTTHFETTKSNKHLIIWLIIIDTTYEPSMKLAGYG
jgi:hypothetical protein